MGQAYVHGWCRVYGNHGIYWETHGGGWQMTDSSWMRLYNNKKLYVSSVAIDAIYTNGAVRADKGFRWGTQSLDDRYAKKRATNTTEGGIKMRISGTTLYITNNGNNA